MSDAFWLIQFACMADDKDKYFEQFFKWADTVTDLQQTPDVPENIV